MTSLVGRFLLSVVLLSCLLPIRGQEDPAQTPEVKIELNAERIRNISQRVESLEQRVTAYNVETRLAKLEDAVNASNKAGEANARMLRGILIACVIFVGKPVVQFVWASYLKKESHHARRET